MIEKDVSSLHINGMSSRISGKVFVVGDNIDTDQIIPAEYLNLIPTIKEEYDKLGSYALCGFPESNKARWIAIILSL